MPTRKPASKLARSAPRLSARKPAQRRARPRVAHLHVVLDPAMLRQLEKYAAQLDPRTANLSAAVRALLRVGLDAASVAPAPLALHA